MKNFLFAIFLLLGVLCGRAQVPEDTTIFFVNIYPGSEIYELEGHSAIIVNIPGQLPMAYNFGVFDFNSPNFVYRFVKGETDYMAVEWPAVSFLAPYADHGRRVMAHELNFTSEQKSRLISLLKENVKRENAVYRYNYVKDNCATRPLRAVELAAGDSIHLAPAPFEANSSVPVTFRNIMRHYHKNYPWYQFGIDMALGSGIDYPLRRREMAFAPAELDKMLANAEAGGKKLVSRSFPLIDFPEDNAVEDATTWFLTPLAVCWFFFAVTLVITVSDIRRRRVTRWFDAMYFGLLGLAGCLLTFLIFISVHEATSPNYVYLWLNPFCLLVPVLIFVKRTSIVLICYQIANFAVLLALPAIWYFLPQSVNPAFLPLVAAEMLRSASYIFVTCKNSEKS